MAANANQQTMQRAAESQQPQATAAAGNPATGAVAATGAQGGNQAAGQANQAGATGTGQAAGATAAGGGTAPHQGQITKGMKDRAESAKAYIESKYQKLKKDESNRKQAWDILQHKM